MKNLVLSIGSVVVFSTIGSSQNGELLFNESIMHEIHVVVPFTELADTLFFHYNEDQAYTLCSATVDGTVLDSVGIKFKGFYSAWACPNDKLPIKFDFGEFKSGQKYNGLKKVNLANGFKDPTLMRDAVCYRTLRQAGIPAPRTAYTKVFFNGVFFGLYLMVEEPDKKFLERHYPDKNGNMYKSNGSDLSWEGSSKSAYTDNFEQTLKQSGDSSFSDLIHLHSIVNNTSSTFYDSLVANFNTDYFFKSIAVDYLVANWDNLIGHGRNFSLYHSTTNNTFNWIPWDYNLAFSDWDIDVLWTSLSSSGSPANAFWDRCMANTTLKNEYLQRVCNINRSVFKNTFLDSYIDSLKTLIRPAFVSDPNKFYTGTEFDNCIVSTSTVMEYDIFSSTSWPVTYPGLKSLIASRHSLAESELAGQGFDCLTRVDNNPNDLLLNVYPNPVTNMLTVQLPGVSEAEITLISTEGKIVLHESYIGSSIVLNVQNLTHGLYLLKVTAQNKAAVLKLVKE